MRRQLTALLAAALSVSLAGLATEYTASAVPAADTAAGTTPASANKGAGKPDIAAHTVPVNERRSASEFWTPERMRNAISSDTIRVTQRELDRVMAKTAREAGMKTVAGEPRKPAAGAAAQTGSEPTARRKTTGERWRHPKTGVARTTGRLFYRLRGTNRSCSAGVINGKRRSVIATAGHCVFSDTKPRRWSKKMIFIPGYKNGRRPFGTYRAVKMWTTPKWRKNRKAFHKDVAFVRLSRRVGGGRHVATIVGAQGYRFGVKGTPWTHEFGYPSKKPAYAGKFLIHCAGDSKWDRPYRKRMYRVRCRMNQGSSGGPWLRAWKKGGWGKQYSNVSLVSWPKRKPKFNWGPVWDRAAYNAYKKAHRKR